MLDSQSQEADMALSPVGLGTRYDCAGEDQQQFSSQVGRSVPEFASEVTS
jgi:hypothetical protein